jgi:hypothetical protein
VLGAREREGSRRWRQDDGAGQIGTVFGLLVFLVFLLFACQMLLLLFRRTAAGDAAMLGAQRIARGATATEAQESARQAVGRAFRNGQEIPDSAPADYVTYEVTIEAPGIMGSPWLGPWATDDISRSARARRERLR